MGVKNENDFDGALKYYQSKHYNPHDMMIAFGKEIQTSLKIAKSVQEGRTSQVMDYVGSQAPASKISINQSRPCYKAMTSQLIKEINNED